MSGRTLIPLNIARIALRDRTTGKITTEDDQFWDKTIFDAVVENLP
jgi:hypothetical protein